MRAVKVMNTVQIAIIDGITRGCGRSSEYLDLLVKTRFHLMCAGYCHRPEMTSLVRGDP